MTDGFMQPESSSEWQMVSVMVNSYCHAELGSASTQRDSESSSEWQMVSVMVNSYCHAELDSVSSQRDSESSSEWQMILCNPNQV